MWIVFLLVGWWFFGNEVSAFELPLEAIDGFEEVMGRGSDPKTYNYAPTIMYENGIYRMWWCGNFEPMTTPESDKILYASSTDGVHFGQAVKVLDSQGQPNQGRCACDPTVVRPSNDEYYLFYTTDGPWYSDGMWSNQVFLAWTNESRDPARMTYAFGGEPVIPLPTDFDINAKLWGRGQSSVLWKDDGLVTTHIDVTATAGGWISARRSIDGGKNFSLIKENLGIVATSMDIKWMPNRRMYLAVAESPQWHLTMFLFDENFELLERITFPVAENSIDNGKRSNHNPGLLGDRYGNVIDEERPTIYFASSGEVTELPAPTNPYNWKIYRTRVDLGPVWESLGYGLRTGDANGDGVVNVLDFAVWKIEFLRKSGLTSDFDKDGRVTIADFALWKREYLTSRG